MLLRLEKARRLPGAALRHTRRPPSHSRRLGVGAEASCVSGHRGESTLLFIGIRINSGAWRHLQIVERRGAECANRPGFLRLMNASACGPKWRRSWSSLDQSCDARWDSDGSGRVRSRTGCASTRATADCVRRALLCCSGSARGATHAMGAGVRRSSLTDSSTSATCPLQCCTAARARRRGTRCMHFVGGRRVRASQARL
jgi:hypothetical protein